MLKRDFKNLCAVGDIVEVKTSGVNRHDIGVVFSISANKGLVTILTHKGETKTYSYKLLRLMKICIFRSYSYYTCTKMGGKVCAGYLKASGDILNCPEYTYHSVD